MLDSGLKAELLQLNNSQCPSLGTFVSKKVGNQKKLCRNFYVIFLRNVSSNNVRIALGKTQNAENQKP